MATRWRVLNRRRARKIRREAEAKWRRFDQVTLCDHEWAEEYYGHRCSKCDLFYAHGCAPWDYYGDEPGIDYVNTWFDDDDDWECEFGAACLVPHFVHHRSECYTVEMAQDWQDEQMREVS